MTKIDNLNTFREWREVLNSKNQDSTNIDNLIEGIESELSKELGIVLLKERVIDDVFGMGGLSNEQYADAIKNIHIKKQELLSVLNT